MESEPTIDPFTAARLPSISQISSAFVALGGPPTPFRVSPAVFDVLRFIGALGVHARTSPSATLVEIKPLVWNHFIEPWLKALLIMYLVTTMETSPTSLEIRRDVLWFVPWCLNSFIDIPFQFVLSESSEITCAVTPQLQYLFVRVWLEVLREGHAACGRWSMLLLKLNLKHGADANPHTNPELFNAHTLGALKIENIPAFRCYLVTMTSQLSSAGEDGLSAFSTFMYLLADIVPRAKVVNSQPGHERQGIYRALVDETLSPLIRLLTKVLRIRRSVKDEDEFYRKNKIDPILLLYRALANGILSTFLKRPSCLSALTPELQLGVYTLFDRFSRFIIYPTVAKQFARAARIGGITFDNHIRTTSLSACWQDCKAKALYVCAIREDLRGQGALYRCTVVTCNNVDVAKFKSCLACETVYCSRACQKMDWAAGHRARCSSTVAIKNRVEFTYRFVESVAKAYLIANASGVNEIIDSYVDKLPQLAMDEKDNLLGDVGLVMSKKKYPILVFNLDVPGMPPPNVWIEAVGNDVAAGLFKPSTGTGPVLSWRATTERKLFVIALLPGEIGFAQESAVSFNLSWPPK
ncbi:hypothetical protein AAF712_012019 [Marasmius tenuissimus]|uniref:MYND-type domain-containing protein n=1 Tax=Marasmius tenuissimus TaxID=585030 RepID=A0ABR2ZAA0_9AGAR